MEVKNIQEGSAGGQRPESPSPALAGIIYVTDKRERRIGLKKLKPSQRFMLAEAVQTKTPSGEMQAIFAASVFSIGEDGCPPITSSKDLMKRLDDLDDDGLAAITPELLKLYGLTIDEKDIAAAKNS